MQQLLQHLMSGLDLLKLFMLLGIAAALVVHYWLGEDNKRLVEKNRRNREQRQKELAAFAMSE